MAAGVTPCPPPCRTALTVAVEPARPKNLARPLAAGPLLQAANVASVLHVSQESGGGGISGATRAGAAAGPSLTLSYLGLAMTSRLRHHKIGLVVVP